MQIHEKSNKSVNEYDKFNFQTILKSAKIQFSTLYENANQNCDFFNFFSESEFLEFMNSGDLNVRNEMHVYMAICDYINSKKSTVSSKTIEELKKCVNLHAFSKNELNSISKDGIFSLEVLFSISLETEFKIARLRKTLLENISISLTETDLKNVKRIDFCELFDTEASKQAFFLENPSPISKTNDIFFQNTAVTKHLNINDDIIQFLKNNNVISLQNKGRFPSSLSFSSFFFLF